MAKLTDLPNELLIHITELVGYFPMEFRDQEESRPELVDLLNLACCSRHFHRVVEPVLYTHFHQQSVAWEDGCTSVFLCRLVERPDLAACVKSLYIRKDLTPTTSYLGRSAVASWLGTELTDPKTKYSLPQKPRLLIKAALSELYEPGEADSMWNRVISGDRGVILCCILSLTPNLEVLHLRHWWGDHAMEYLDALLRQAALLQSKEVEAPGSLSNLKQIAFDLDPLAPGYSRHETQLPFMQAPSLSSVAINRLSTLFLLPNQRLLQSEDVVSWQPISLNLVGCSVEQSPLINLFDLLPPLHTFSIGFRSMKRIPMRGSAIMIERLQASKFKSTLQNLRIINDDYNPDELSIKLSGFPNLKTLDVVGDCRSVVQNIRMIDTEVQKDEAMKLPLGQRILRRLPASLERLRLRTSFSGDHFLYLEHITSVLENKDAWLPNLRVLDLRTENHNGLVPKFTLKERKRILKLGRDKEVEIVLGMDHG